jgi:hypothetical protein
LSYSLAGANAPRENPERRTLGLKAMCLQNRAKAFA